MHAVRGGPRAAPFFVQAFAHGEVPRLAGARVFRMAFHNAAGVSFREILLRAAISFSTREVPDQRCCRELVPASMSSSLVAGKSWKSRKKRQLTHACGPVQTQHRPQTRHPRPACDFRPRELSIIRGDSATGFCPRRGWMTNSRPTEFLVAPCMCCLYAGSDAPRANFQHAGSSSVKSSLMIVARLIATDQRSS